MTSIIRLACILAAAVLAASATAATALAQAFPARPIHIIVPFPPGGPNDFFARVLGNKLTQMTGQTMVIENRAGAAGTLGVSVVAHAQPDGYTLVLTSMGSLTVFPVIAKNPTYDPAKDLAPITIVAKVPEVLVAIPKLNFHTLADLITYAKAHPGKINFASAGSGGLPHLAGELLKHEAGIDIVHIPYAGAAPAVADLLAGNVDVVFLDIPVLLPQIQAGKLIPLALGSAKRAPTLPNVPTTAEAGYPNVLADNWYSLLGPGAMPKPLVEKINQLVVEALKDPGVQEQYAKQGAAAVGDSPAEFAAYMKAETEKWGPIAKAAGVTLD
ncbi:MAG TPA: tripartite tricarboxylate transporter substrate binding protein [Alphaproteobacteria bacterium]|nr:tripartite tricarboxylate transporter substrate binding protein [Alphaproteobacteria bacterium]